MKKSKFTEIVNHIWNHRDYLYPHDEFDFPFYGGLRSRMGSCSPEAVDAMQYIWDDFRMGFEDKRTFAKAYKNKLLELGEKIT